MTHQGEKIARIRKRAKQSDVNISNYKTNCIRALNDGFDIMQIHPLALFFLIDKIEQLENNLKAVKNELKQIELLSADMRHEV